RGSEKRSPKNWNASQANCSFAGTFVPNMQDLVETVLLSGNFLSARSIKVSLVRDCWPRSLSTSIPIIFRYTVRYSASSAKELRYQHQLGPTGSAVPACCWGPCMKYTANRY